MPRPNPSRSHAVLALGVARSTELMVIVGALIMSIGIALGEGTGLVSLAQARERWLATLETILARADGSLRADATAPEITILFGGVCRVLASSGEADPAVWRRHAELVADAFRPSRRDLR